MTAPSTNGAGRSSALEAALRYAQLGWPVLPCKADKKPYIAHDIEHGFESASVDARQIKKWWQRWPDALIGVATAQAGLIVIDTDGDEGRGHWQALLDEHGDVDCSLQDSSPRGGHLHFAAPPDARVKTDSAIGGRKGLDVRAGWVDENGKVHSGGYIIVPPGPGREWVDNEPEDVVGRLVPPPDWLLDLLQRRPPSAAAAPRPELPQIERDRIEVASALHSIPPTVGRSTWLDAIYAVHAKCTANSYGAQLVEQWSSLSDAKNSKEEPQYKPGEARNIYTGATLPEDRPDLELINEGTLFALAREYGWRAAGIGDDVVIKLGMPGQQHQEIGEQGPPTEDEDDKEIIYAADWFEVADLPVQEWQVDGLLPERSLAMLAGDTEAGKSFVAIDLALRMVHGLPLLGRKVEPGSVLYLAGEGYSGLAARLRAWRDQHNVDAAATDGRYLYIADGIPLLSMLAPKKTKEKKGKTNDPTLLGLVERVAKKNGHAPALIVIDTLSQGLDDDENDAKVVSPVLRRLSNIRKKFGCSVLIVHHLVKLNTKGGPTVKPTKDSIRGSGALTRNVDVVLGLVHDEATGARTILPWKSKDAEKPSPIGLRLHRVETGRRRRNGQPETSCIVIPDAAAGIVQAVDPEVRNREAEARGIEKLVAAVRREGAFGSRDSLVLAAGVRQQYGRALLDLALQRGDLVDVGRPKRPRFVQPGTAGEGAEQGGRESPHTHKGRDGTDPVRPERPEQTGTVGTVGTDSTDDGMPEQPGGRRRRSARGSNPPDPGASSAATAAQERDA